MLTFEASKNGDLAYQVFTEEPQVVIHSQLAQLSMVWQELYVEKTLTKEIIKSSVFERLRKAVNNAAFIVTGARGGTPHMKVMGMVGPRLA